MHLTVNKHTLYYILYTLVHGSAYMSHPQGESNTKNKRHAYINTGINYCQIYGM
jgi:hypothetical protein